MMLLFYGRRLIGKIRSKKTADNPTLKEFHLLHQYERYDAFTDAPITMDEFDEAINKLGTGTGLDGVSPEIFRIVPIKVKEYTFLLYNQIFGNMYPEMWRKQLILPSTKKGHTVKEPEPRGIAVGPVLSRIYDIIIDKRFC